MESLIRRFGERLAEQKGIGLFYYSGHGVQSNNKNYLIPIDADIPTEDEISYQSVDVGLLLGKMGTAENDVNLVILDACRNNPFAKQWRKFKTMEAENGLAGITKAPTGTIIAYATQPDATASDGIERNGLYTAELLKQIRRKDLTINQVFQNTRAEVVRKSANKQVPWELSSLLKDLYISGTASGTISETPQSNPGPNNQVSKLTIDTPVINVDSNSTAPVQILPNNNSIFSHFPRNTVFKWSPISNVLEYRIEINVISPSNKDGFRNKQWVCDGSNFCKTISVKQTDYSFSFWDICHVRWRVWAIFDNGKEGPSSPWREFEYKR
jgi:hypothetical protein